MKRILAPKIVVYIWFTGSLFMTVEVAEVARSDYSNALRPIYTRRYSCGISRGIAHLSNQRTFIYFCVTPERYRAGSLPERYSCGIPPASRPLDQSALLFCCCHATASDDACR